MRFSARSKVGVLLSLVTILTLVSAFAVTIISRGSPTHASTGSTSSASQVQTFTSHSFTLPGAQAAISNPVSSKSAKTHPTRDLGVLSSVHGGRSSQTSSGVHPASVSSSLTDQGNGNTLHKFNGLSNLDNSAYNPFTVEPPDQGVCAGYILDQATGQKIPMEYEMVNDVIAIYLPNGKQVIAMSLETFFGEKNFLPNSNFLVGNPHCHFDRQTHTFFFSATVIGTDTFLPPSSKSHIDLAAINANTPTKGIEVLVDTTDTSNPNCPCYASIPNLGLDNNAVYLSYNEGTINSNTFQAAVIVVYPKSPFVNQVFPKHVYGFTLPASDGIFGLQPAINVSSANSEYLESAFGSNELALLHVTNDQNIDGGVPPILNPGKLVTVEAYSTPVPAVSTGDGSVDSGFTSATTLNAGDGRLQQVEGIQDEGHIELWSSLDTAVSIKGDSQVRDGIAWFRIDPGSASVVEQAIVASPGNYLIYPAIMHSNNGTTAIVFTVTSKTTNPSAAYVLSPSSPTNFGSAFTTVAQGSGPYLTAFGLWGNYSAAALALNGNDIWLATEYVPPLGTTTFGANWGTEVFDVSNGN